MDNQTSGNMAVTNNSNNNSINSNNNPINGINSTNARSNMVKDTFLYLPAKIIEGAVGVVTLSLLTRLFKPDDYGNYHLAVTTVSIVSLFLLGWLYQAAFRYVNNFTGKRKVVVFYSTIFVVWAVISVSITILGLIILFSLRNRFDAYTLKPVLFSIFMFFSYSLAQILLYMLSAARIIKLFVGLSVLSAILKPIFLILFVKVFYTGVSGAIISLILIDALVIVVIIYRLRIYRYINMRFFSSRVAKKFSRYGIPLVGVSLSASLLNYSDNYILKFFRGSDYVGIYSANYSIASSAFTALLFAIMRGVYPTILKTWKQNNKTQTEGLLSNAVRYFMIITVPAVVGISVLSHVISNILDPLYVEGSSVMIFVSIGMFFYGLSEYNNKAWELTSNTGVIFRNILFCCLFNIIINIITIPFGGYMAAAVNKALAFMFYFLLSYLRGRKILKWHIAPASLMKIFGSAALMGLIIYIAVSSFESVSILHLLILVPLGVVVYGIGLYLTGEIKQEFKQLVALKTKK
ncbi:MAG TPA: oligosaccharide flippase family protein [Clostridiaceae bacterium]|nr:oligosaccharide flippase family protein [Clostridiaceae bacterium]